VRETLPLDAIFQALNIQSLPPLLIAPLCQLASHLSYFSESSHEKPKSEMVKDIHQLWVKLRGLLITLTCSAPTPSKLGVSEETGLVLSSLLQLLELLKEKFPLSGKLFLYTYLKFN
jgi:hypothetical protein